MSAEEKLARVETVIRLLITSAGSSEEIDAYLMVLRLLEGLKRC